MARIEIDITGFDPSDNTLVEYGLTQHDFENPLATLRAIGQNPAMYLQRDEDYRLVLTARQNQRFLRYLAAGRFHLDSFGEPADACWLLAFSYGESPVVNTDLANIVESLARRHRGLSIAAQWEIADLLEGRGGAPALSVNRIGSGDKAGYITTADVIDEFIHRILDPDAVRHHTPVFLVAQAWHAPRCFELCSRKGLHVVGGEFSELFSPSDNQEWVRNAFSWVLKEGTQER